MANIVKGGTSRIFISEGGAGPNHPYVYHYQLSAGQAAQPFGDVTQTEEPSATAYNEFDVIDETRGATERATLPLTGRYRMSERSELLRLAEQKCTLDLAVHFGICQDPSAQDSYEKILQFENGYLTNWSADNLGALTSGDKNPSNETSDLSARRKYEILPVGASEKAGSIVTNEILWGWVCDALSCGNCGATSDGAKKIMGVTKAAGGSPTTPADLVYTLDGGITWYAHDIDCFAITQDVESGVCSGNYVVVVSSAGGGLGYTTKASIDGVTDPTFTKVTTGFVGKPYCIDAIGTTCWIGGEGGYIYKTDDPTAGVTVMDAGVATVAALKSVEVFSQDLIVLAGSRAVVYTLNGTDFQKCSDTPGPIAQVLALLVHSEKLWFVGMSDGRLYYTTDYGVTWVRITGFAGDGTGSITALGKSTNNVLWMARQTAATKGLVYKSINGGKTWIAVPEKAGSFPACDKINAFAVTVANANYYCAMGLADNASDGIVVVGQNA
jgi:hypothetical protein